MKKSANTRVLNDPSTEKLVTFIQYDIPPLKSGEYTVELEQKVNKNTGNPYKISRKFAVTGERFTFRAEEIDSVFPPNLSNGEFAGVFPHVVFNRRTLPWERTSVAGDITAPWLAVLLFNEGEVPLVKQRKVTELVPAGVNITVQGSSVTGVGEMPAGYISHPGLEKLNYGEIPTEELNAIDIPALLFNQVCPSSAELPYLAHVRETETIDKTDGRVLDDGYFSIVTGNRISQAKDNANSQAFLVSLENMGAYLPDGTGANKLPQNTSFVRLICYASWTFTVNNDDQTFTSLLENLNKTNGKDGLSSLQYPFAGTPPGHPEVVTALTHAANNTLTSTDADVLVKNAFVMGYSPYTHYLRHPGNTISWYRGPLSPYRVSEHISVPISTPDAINRYDPETGLFDISYGSAWQLGQLMALQNKGFASALYNWKKSQWAQTVAEEEQKIINEKYNIKAFSGIMQARSRHLYAVANEAPPEYIVKWLGRLALLHGVPFNYLVPDEQMLPPESIRFFYMDNNWIDCLLDGAFSIGRSTTAEQERDKPTGQKLMMHAKKASKLFRPRKAKLKDAQNASGAITGFLLRSAVVRGWPGLEVNGYRDKEADDEVTKLRFDHLSEEVMICIFDDVVQMVAIHEPPEALHSGVTKDGNAFKTSLRVIAGNKPGSPIVGGFAPVVMRADQQTMQVQKAADSVWSTLKKPPYNEQIPLFTSAEYALEMIKGVVKVNFENK